ncbi:hypothetical protein [Staphylococcus phage LY01]|nr:hypothetical protein [Staphylococcus phage LY01]
MNVETTFNVEMMENNEKDFNYIISNIMSFHDKRKLYNEVNDDNEVLTYIFNNYKNELYGQNSSSIIVTSENLKELIRHSVVDYHLFVLLRNISSPAGFHIEGFVEILEEKLFKPKQETLRQFSSKDDIIYLYYNTTLNKIVKVDPVMYLKSLMEYVKEEKEFYGDLSIEFEKAVKKYLVEKNFK